jgi:hypothetical protein
MRAEMVEVSSVATKTDILTSMSNESCVAPDWQLVVGTLSNQPIEQRHTRANTAARLDDMATIWTNDINIRAVVYNKAANMKETGDINIICANNKLHLAATGSMRCAQSDEQPCYQPPNGTLLSQPPSLRRRWKRVRRPWE